MRGASGTADGRVRIEADVSGVRDVDGAKRTAFAVRVETPQGPRFVAFDQAGKLMMIALGSTDAAGMEALLWWTRGCERVCSPELVSAGHGHWKAAVEEDQLDDARLGIAWAISIGTTFGRIPPAWLIGALLGKLVEIRKMRAWERWTFRRPVPLTSYTVLEDGRDRTEEWTLEMTSGLHIEIRAARAKSVVQILFGIAPPGTATELARAGIDRWPTMSLTRRGKPTRFRTDAELVELTAVLDAAIGTAEDDDGTLTGSTISLGDLVCTATVLPDDADARPKREMLN